MRKSALYFVVMSLIMAFAAVLILAAPAARVGDNHTCPQVTGVIPHVGGPIISGSPNVIICGNQAATVSSFAVCNGPLDQITQGSATVFINGLPAARQGDASAHGGTIVQGCPTVSIGP
jgi:uncharacterized Zn-binding protein involved in type VI secretion